MSSSVLCVDISDGRMVGLLLSVVGKNVKLLRQIQLPSPEDATQESLVETLAEAVGQEGLSAGSSRLLVDSASAMFRSYFFPFAGRAQVAKSVAYELADDLPVDISNVYHDFTHIKAGKKFSRACVAVYDKASLGTLVRSLEQIGFSPECVEPEVCGLGRAAMFGLKTRPDTSIIIDVGRNRTVVAALKGELPALVHVLHQGVPNFLQSQETPMPLDEAERLLAFTDFSGASALSAQQLQLRRGIVSLANILAMATDRFTEELGDWPGPVFVSGEFCSIKGLKDILSEILAREIVVVMERAEVRAVLGQEDLLQGSTLLGALGGGLRPLEPGRGMNLRGEDIAFVAPDRKWQRQLRYVFLLIITCVACAGLMQGARVYHESRLLALYQKASEQLFASVLPDAGRDFSLAQQVSILRSRIDQLLGTRSIQEGSGMPVLEELLLLHTSLPPNIDIEFDTMNRDHQRSAIAGTAKSFAEVEALRNGLSSTGKFAAVEIKGAAVDQKTGRVRFELALGRP